MLLEAKRSRARKYCFCSADRPGESAFDFPPRAMSKSCRNEVADTVRTALNHIPPNALFCIRIAARAVKA